MKKKLLLIPLALLLGISLVAVGGAAPAPSKTLDIGIAAPISGPAAALGISTQNAILLAIDDQNKEGGVTIAGQKYTLNAVIRDTKMDVAVGTTVAEELVYDEKVKIIAGCSQIEAMGMQPVTEANKVIMFTMLAIPQLGSPDKPHTFFPGSHNLALYAPGGAYIQKFYPKAKTVFSTYADLPDAPGYWPAVEAICARNGLDWLGYELWPATTTDFTAIIPRLLKKNPDIIDTAGTGGGLGGLCVLLIKQLREAGFDGVIWAPTLPPPFVLEKAVPEQYRTGIVCRDVDMASPIVSQAYKDWENRYIKKFGEPPVVVTIASQFYNTVNAFLEFLDGQDTMGTTAWAEGFAEYHWQSLWGYEEYCVGKPLIGIDRIILPHFWISEWTNGELVTKFNAPIPYDLFVEK